MLMFTRNHSFILLCPSICKTILTIPTITTRRGCSSFASRTSTKCRDSLTVRVIKGRERTLHSYPLISQSLLNIGRNKTFSSVASTTSGSTHNTTSNNRAKKFKDSLTIRVSGGKGGDGCQSHEGRSVGKEVPDGGHGGRGGDVVLIAKENFQDFSHFNSFHLKGKDGKNGSGQGKTGKRGEDLELFVPIGTAVYKAGPSRKERQAMLAEEEDDDYYHDEELNRSGPPSFDDREARLLADLSEPDSRYIVARGGFPGQGNIMQSTKHYYSQKQLTPRERMGQPGTSAAVELRLKSIADACLVGYPNAGKSSLLGAISHSRPKVASYPFTTLHPHIGLLEFSDARKVSLADLPGLVDGASENRGMGHQFLQHVERCKVLVFVLDGAPESYERSDAVHSNNADASQHASIAQDLENLVKELELYMEGLSSRPSLVVINKMDRPDADTKVNDEMQRIRAILPESCEGRIFCVSARDGTGLEDFVVSLRQVVEKAQQLEQEEELHKRGPSHIRKEKYRPLNRIGRAQEGRRALLHRIKRKEATHQGDQVMVWRKRVTTKNVTK
jgi:GTP-binding protein